MDVMEQTFYRWRAEHSELRIDLPRPLDQRFPLEVRGAP